ncbi:unnamed protein product [Peronospora farinosa]|uniref:Peptidase S33 tripeptidyl aminopeptidase-like C-terminal domain-containing protein n=1 Tax=Peronospora farinosa TaxID=134698 RepID=A0ABN8BVQ1_9STRA|nr:unnamed protein product [Peronospora farinosa]
MKLYPFMSLVAMVTQVLAAPNPSHLKWFACSDGTSKTSEDSAAPKAECAFYRAPLCYPGICNAPKHADPIVKIFVKRFPAVNNPEMASNMWLLQGGSGHVSASSIHAGLKGAVNVYTMDHRGTGRITLLDCVGMQLGSPSSVSQVPACAQALEKKYGDLASFSVTSAATDVATFISDFTNGLNTIVCGVSYGTVVVERLMHLNPPQVTGYVLDSIATTSGASRDKTFFASAWDSNFGEVGDAFLALCATTSECSKWFVSKSLPATLQDVITKFDKKPKSTCAALVSKLYRDQSSEPASYLLRRTLSILLMDASLRTLIPPIVYRLSRCKSKDVDVLRHFFMASIAAQSVPSNDSAFASFLLYYLVVYSEMWEKPTPSTSEMTSRVTNALISSAQVYSDVPIYCAFSKEKSPVCDQLDVGNYDGNGIIYEVDKYWNKSATIPPQASVLLLSGTLDVQTPHKYAESLLEVLVGEKKELVAFEYATHNAIVSTPLNHGKETCGMKILLSYVKNDGDLKLLDKSCVDEMPAFSISPKLDDQYHYLSTDDAYDGRYNKRLSASASS